MRLHGPQSGAVPEVGPVHHVAVKTKRVETLTSFYRDVLGLAETTRHEDERGLRSVWLDARGTTLMIERSDTDGSRPDFPADPPGLHLLAFQIPADAHDAWRDHLAAHEVAVVHTSPFTLYVTDPDGNRIGLSSHPEPRQP